MIYSLKARSPNCIILFIPPRPLVSTLTAYWLYINVMSCYEICSWFSW